MWIDSVHIVETNKNGENIYEENTFAPDYEITDALRINLRSEEPATLKGEATSSM